MSQWGVLSHVAWFLRSVSVPKPRRASGPGPLRCPAAAIGTSIAIATCVPGCWHYACMTKRMTGDLARWPYRGMGPIGTIPAKKCESLSQLLYANYYSYVRVQWQRTNALKVRISIETLYHCFIDTSMIVVIECIERSAI